MTNKTTEQRTGQEESFEDGWSAWSVRKARKVERALIDLLGDIPEISHLEGCSYSGLGDYKVQFMFQEEYQPGRNHNVIEYHPDLNQLFLNSDPRTLRVSPILWHKFSNRILKSLSWFRWRYEWRRRRFYS